MKKIIKRLIPNKVLHFIRRKNYNINNSRFLNKTPEQTFSEIYRNNHWNGEESISGRGSEMDQTETIINELNKIIKELNIKTILDLPCGDFNWMNSVNLENLNYIGGDIVKELISENNKRYAATNIKFINLNLIEDKLPKSDLIFCRDCLVHLSYSDIRNSLENIKSSNSKYLLTTTFTEHKKNYDICTGDWRALNLEVHPFNMIKPIKIIKEKCSEEAGGFKDKSLLLYEISELTF